MIADARPGSGRITGEFLGAQPGEVLTASGTSLSFERTWDRNDVAVVVLPSLALPWLEPDQQPPGLTDWVTSQHQRGALVLALGTGSHLLAQTGLLDGHPATTHWACLDRCRRDYPAVAWAGAPRLTVTGRLVTARDMGAAATAICHAIGHVLSGPIAERTHQYSLIHEPDSRALPQLHTMALRDHRDTAVLEVQDWLDTHYDQPLTAADAARLVHMSPRHLRRRFLAATGQTLTAYLTGIRLAHARALLLSTTEPTSHIAHAIGYQDPSTFTALFKQHHGLTPSAFRRTAEPALA